MVEGVAWVTSSFGALWDGVKGPGRERELFGSGSAVDPSGRRGRTVWVDCSVNQGPLNVLHKATNRLRFIFRAETDCQNFSPTAYFMGRLGAISLHTPAPPPQMGAFQKQRREGRLGGERWVGKAAVSFSTGFRTTPADVGRAPAANSLSLGQFPKFCDAGGRALSRLYKRIQELLDTECSLRMGHFA